MRKRYEFKRPLQFFSIVSVVSGPDMGVGSERKIRIKCQVNKSLFIGEISSNYNQDLLKLRKKQERGRMEGRKEGRKEGEKEAMKQEGRKNERT